MSLSLVQSRALLGLEAASVTVEVHLANGLPSFTLVGLADVEVKEARERVRCAIQNAGLEFPNNKRITVNLAPADLPRNCLPPYSYIDGARHYGKSMYRRDVFAFFYIERGCRGERGLIHRWDWPPRGASVGGGQVLGGSFTERGGLPSRREGASLIALNITTRSVASCQSSNGSTPRALANRTTIVIDVATAPRSTKLSWLVAIQTN